MKTRITIVTALLSLLVFLTGTIRADQPVNGVWIDQTGQMRLEVRQNTHGLDIREYDQSSWQDCDRLSAGYYRARSSQTRLRFVGDQLQYTPRDGQKTWILYPQYSNRDRNYGQGNSPAYRNDRDWDDRDWDDRDWDDRDWNRYDFKAMEGTWYNRSTGIRIEIKETRKDLRIRFNRDGWSDLRRYRNGSFIDEEGNQIHLQSHGVIEYQSANGDLTMIFTDRPGAGSSNRVFRGHNDFDRF